MSPSTDALVYIITGPTASGKTALAEKLLYQLDGEIINADMGQFYTPLSIGTAKPDWRSQQFRSHLFDVVDQPIDVSVNQYRQWVLPLVNDIIARGKVPIIVGGSIFYIKSLFYPPHLLPAAQDMHLRPIDFDQPTEALWQRLQSIDPIRAQDLHPNDQYRIVRALEIWQKTGKQPSTYKPVFSPPFNAYVIGLIPEKDFLQRAIAQRTYAMLEQGWVKEADDLRDTQWEVFVRDKGFIGYEEILDRGLYKNIDTLAEQIIIGTRQYAKRQQVFWRKFKEELALEQAMLGDHNKLIVSEISNEAILFEPQYCSNLKKCI
jgi:tRNA dimethylallyltransferase